MYLMQAIYKVKELDETSSKFHFIFVLLLLYVVGKEAYELLYQTSKMVFFFKKITSANR